MEPKPHLPDHAHTRAEVQFPDDPAVDLSRQRLLDPSSVNFPPSDSSRVSYEHQQQYQQRSSNYEQQRPQQQQQQQQHQQNFQHSPFKTPYIQPPQGEYESSQQNHPSTQPQSHDNNNNTSDTYAQIPVTDNNLSKPQFYPAPPKKSAKSRRRISKKTRKRLYWIVPACILILVIVILFSVYKDDFERWVKPLSDWLKARDSWSWTIPVLILIVLSLPPLFGHELVQLVVGLAYPLGVAIGIAIAGAVLGEAVCFVVFKLFGSKYVKKKIDTKVRWAAVARVSQEAGFKGVLVIRYSIVPPHLANPLFACTGMTFWLYMITVILSLPKSIVFVALGSPSAKGNNAAKWGKVVAIGILILVTILASIWIRRRLRTATLEIEAERGIVHESEDDSELSTYPSYAQASQMEQQTTKPSYGRHGVTSADTAYHGA